MVDNEPHRSTLQELNRNCIRFIDEADVAWFDANLAPDFFNTIPWAASSTARFFCADHARLLRQEHPRA